MAENPQGNKEETKNNNDFYFEARQNLLGFFNLLLQIDKRNNPQNYQKPKNNEDNRDTNNPNKA